MPKRKRSNLEKMQANIDRAYCKSRQACLKVVQSMMQILFCLWTRVFQPSERWSEEFDDACGKHHSVLTQIDKNSAAKMCFGVNSNQVAQIYELAQLLEEQISMSCQDIEHTDHKTAVLAAVQILKTACKAVLYPSDGIPQADQVSHSDKPVDYTEEEGHLVACTTNPQLSIGDMVSTPDQVEDRQKHHIVMHTLIPQSILKQANVHSFPMCDQREIDMEKFEDAVETCLRLLREGKQVRVHCSAGENRSSLVVIRVLQVLNPYIPVTELIKDLEERKREVCYYWNTLTNRHFREYLLTSCRAKYATSVKNFLDALNNVDGFEVFSLEDRPWSRSGSQFDDQGQPHFFFMHKGTLYHTALNVRLPRDQGVNLDTVQISKLTVMGLVEALKCLYEGNIDSARKTRLICSGNCESEYCIEPIVPKITDFDQNIDNWFKQVVSFAEHTFEDEQEVREALETWLLKPK